MNQSLIRLELLLILLVILLLLHSKLKAKWHARQVTITQELVEVIMPIKNLNLFLRILEMSPIKFKVNLILRRMINRNKYSPKKIKQARILIIWLTHIFKELIDLLCYYLKITKRRKGNSKMVCPSCRNKRL